MSTRGVDKISPACLPVTALETVRCKAGTFLFSGAGSTLNVSTLDASGTFSAARRVFASQAIHGIVTCIVEQSAELITIRVIVWGGRLLALCQLRLHHEAGQLDAADTILLNVVWSKAVDDWILDATSFNRGNAAVLLTAHNVLHRVVLSHDYPLEPGILKAGPQTLLYSGHVAVTEQNTFLVASGSVFGEIVVWQCLEEAGSDSNVWSAHTKHTLFGHSGSVFGVRFSEQFVTDGLPRRLLATCSDDRTVRVWDVSDCDLGSPASDDIQHTGRETGFGGADAGSGCVGMAWGHISRIWNVSFVQNGPFAQDGQVTILSRGEDGACHQWSLNELEAFAKDRGRAVELRSVYGDHHHAGKNAWSWTRGLTDNTCLVLTGGADGQIVARNLQTTSQMKSSEHKSASFRNLLVDVGSQPDPSSPHRRIAGALKDYLVFDDGTLLATSSSGHLLKCRAQDLSGWSIVATEGSGSAITLGDNHFGNLAFYCRHDGRVIAYDNRASRVTETSISLPAQATWITIADNPDVNLTPVSTLHLVVNVSHNHLPRLLTVSLKDRDFLESRYTELQLPLDFVVTCAEYHAPSRSLVCGSRQGAVAVFHNLDGSQSSAEPVLCVRHVHGSDCVTSVRTVACEAPEPTSERCILTTGRDGTYAMHRVDRQCKLSTVHRSVPRLGPYIEGAYFKKGRDGSTSVVLYGFKSTQFIVWDETRQELVFSVDCGGAHRSWAFSPGRATQKLHSFVWTRAGTVNCRQSPCLDDFVLQRGGHGREIKTLAISSVLENELGTLIATGAEDTDIRIFRHRSDSSTEPQRSGFEFIRLLVGHTTGLQHLRFSACGKFLLSSAGCEEMFVWSISRIPLLELGSVLVGRLPKEVEDSDARIMSFDVDSSSSGMEIVMAYSNGKFKRFNYSVTEARFTATGNYSLGMICLTQIAMLVGRRALVGATDGYLRIVEQSGQDIAFRRTVVHQSNISALAVEEMKSGWALVATGGDDNALGVTVLSNHERHWKKTFLIPAAHAAAVTAIAILQTSGDTRTTTSLVVTAGNDQKVKIWQVEIESIAVDDTGIGYPHGDQVTEQISLQAIDVRLTKLGEYWTDVADISDIGVLPQRRAEDQVELCGPKLCQWQVLVVVGVGMQVIDIAL